MLLFLHNLHILHDDISFGIYVYHNLNSYHIWNHTIIIYEHYIALFVKFYHSHNILLPLQCIVDKILDDIKECIYEDNYFLTTFYHKFHHRNVQHLYDSIQVLLFYHKNKSNLQELLN